MTNLRVIANRYRNIPLQEVAATLGGVQDRSDKQKWRFDGGAVWIGKGKDRQSPPCSEDNDQTILTSSLSARLSCRRRLERCCDYENT